MQTKNQQKRREQIEQTTYSLIDKFGYDGISMLKIAKAAKASNETLYRWYGDKKGLFLSLVESNAKEVATLLEKQIDSAAITPKTLQMLGEKLLQLLVSDRAIALNKAAAGDPTGELGAALAQAGRDAIFPMIAQVFKQLCQSQNLAPSQAKKFADIYIRLLIGDLQIRRTTGAIAPLTKKEIKSRAKQSDQLIRQLMEID